MRFPHRIYAFLAGYFWLPCPKCGRMFGGHETQPFAAIEVNGRGWCVCPQCAPAAIEERKKRMQSTFEQMMKGQA
jgi:hypothetical protein